MSEQFAGMKLDFRYYLDHQDELVALYSGKVLAITNQGIIGVYNSEFEAVSETAKEHELGTFLVQRCSPGPKDYTCHYQSRVFFDGRKKVSNRTNKH